MPSGGSGFKIRPADLHGSGSKLTDFGDQLSQGGQKLQSTSQRLVSHAGSDRSGVGAVISKVFGKGTEITGKVFQEGGRVASEAGKRLHSSASNHEANESHQTSVFKGISDPGGNTKHPHGSTEGSGSGTKSNSSGSGVTYKEPDSTPTPGGGGGGENRPNDPRNTGVGAGNRNCASDPVDVATGDVVLAELDLELPGPLALLLERTHVSSYRAGRWFGPSWSSTLDQRLEFDDEGVCYFSPDGMILVYPRPAVGEPVLPVEGPRWPLAVDLDGTHTVTVTETGRTLRFAGRTGTSPLAAVTDEDGNRIDIDRDAQGAPALLRHSAGYLVAPRTENDRVTELHVLGSGRDAGLDVVVLRYAYDDRGRLTEVVNSSGIASHYDYDTQCRLTGWQDRNGTWYRYVYDERGRCVRTVGMAGFVDGEFHYDLDRRVTTYTDSLGNVTVYHLNEANQTIRQTDPLGNTTVSEWDRYDRLAARTDPLGLTTRFEYHDDGTPAAVIRPDGSRVTLHRGDDGSLDIEVDADGRTWRRSYEPGEAPDPLTAPVGVSATTADPAATTTTANDTTAAQAAGGAAGGSETPAGDDGLDVFGRPRIATDASGRTANLGWTVEGKMAWRATPTTRERWRYDGEGNETEHVDALGQAVRREYGAFDLLAATVDATGARTGYEHDTELRLTSVTNPHGQTWRYTYDAAGRLVEEVDFGGRALRFTYDAAGRLTRSVNAAGQAVDHVHDALGNVVELRTDTGSTTYTYDPVGRLTAATSPDASLTIVRDDEGRVTEHTVDGRTVRFGYDALGRRTSRTTAAGVDSVWVYDNEGQAVTLSSTGHVLRFGYDAAGRESQRQVDEGLTVNTTFDPDRLATTQVVTHSDADPAAGDWPGAVTRYRRYDHRADNRIVGVQDDTTGNTTFRLDPNGRVTEVAGPDRTEHYRYDALGNIADASGDGVVPAPRTYDGTALVGVGDLGYRYDAQGRLVHRWRDTPAGAAEAYRYTWDAQDRLTGVVTPDGTTWRYRYDPLGRRIAKQRLDAAGTVVAQVDFLWDGPVLIEQVATDATGRHVTTWEHHPDDSRPLAQWEQGPADDRRFHTIVTDPLGTPVELLDSSGATAWRADSTLWGTPVARTDNTANTPLRFPGQYHDDETGLHYNVYRYYDPATARYLSHDPLGLAPAPNPVTYVDNPLSLSDPLGLTCTTSAGGASAPSGNATPGSSVNPNLVPGTGSSLGKRKQPVSDSDFNNHHVADDHDLDSAAQDYVDTPSVPKKAKIDASETLGEAGAVTYLKAHTGHDDIGLHRPTTDDPHTATMTQGTPWKNAVAFNGSGVADVTYWDGNKLHVVEAKGGGSTLGQRDQAYFHSPTSGQNLAPKMTNPNVGAWRRRRALSTRP
jgi:RHS repeat-associated protein